jgi:hypothetical protein
VPENASRRRTAQGWDRDEHGSTAYRVQVMKDLGKREDDRLSIFQDLSTHVPTRVDYVALSSSADSLAEVHRRLDYVGL